MIERGIIEMEEGKDRNAENDLILYNKYFEDLKLIFEEVLELKNKGNDGSSNSINEKQKSASLLFIMLKKINRLDKYRIRTGRDALQKERIRVDSKRLQLQNLLYEVNHIKREILRCYQFKSQDETIDLVNEEEFYEKAPISISRPDITKDAEHTKRLARLEWELNQRKELFTLCKELTVAKQKAAEEIALKLQRLNSYGPCVASLLKATKPLQQALDMSLEQKWEINRFVKLLPKPLYLAYVNIHSYAEASDPNVSVVILGSEEDIRVYENINPGDVFEDCVESDSDEVETVAKTRKNYMRKEDVLVQQRNLVLQPHPLTVSISIRNSKSSKKSITINMHYFPHLGFVTVTGTINLSKAGCTTGEIMTPENILNHLYDNDSGEMSPTSKISYQLKKTNMTQEECLNHISMNGFGKPYIWAQKMCSITEFEVSDLNCGKPSLEKSIPEILNRIKHSWNSRLFLIKQINALENKNLDLYHTVSKVSRVKHSCSLVLWTSVTWEDILSNVATARFVELDYVKQSNLFYRAVVVRGSSKLECFISISNRFPIACPIWIFSVSWNGQHNALNNSAIKDMEYWTNSVTNQSNNKCAVLSTQLARTMCSFDIFLETEGQFYSPVEFSKDKHFVKTFTKRMRARPYRCVENGTNLTFKQ